MGKSIHSKIQLSHLINWRDIFSGEILVVSILVALFVFLMTSCQPKSSTIESPLNNPEQLHADSVSAQLLKNAEVLKAQAEVAKLFEADSISKSPEGLRAAKQAALEVSLQAIQFTLANDPSHPKFLWFCHAPRNWNGIDLPGSRFGYDNPDNVYRIAFVDSASKYEIKVHHNEGHPIQESFELLDAQNSTSAQIAFVEGKNLKTDANGDYTVTVGSSADSSNHNHLHLNRPTGLILYRNTLNDWATQLPTSIEIKKISGAENKTPRTEKETVESVVKYIDHFSKLLVAFKNSWTYGKNTVNQLGKPFERTGGWGFALAGYYNLNADEAWVIKLNPKAAKYVGFQLADPWLNSLAYVEHSASLNNTQTQADKDGNVTYVISAKDPGTYNWLDNHGDAHGSLLIRWQFLPDGTKNIDDAIIAQEVVKLTDLEKKLSEGVVKIKAEERAKILEARAASFKRRVGK